MTRSIRFESRSQVLAGIGLTSAAYLLFTCQDAAIKSTVATYTVWQILFFRSIVILAGCVAIGGRRLVRDAARSPVMKPMLARSFLILSAWICYYTAARDLQLAELTTIYFAAPVIVTLLAIGLLGERVSLVQWIAVLTGFAGVFLACNPADLGLSRPVLLVLAAAFLWGLSIVMMRKIALQEKTTVQMVLNNVFFLVTAGVPLIFLWRTPDPAALALLVGVGLVGGVAQFCLFEGMKRAPASVVAPFEYTSLVWAFLLGWLIWGDVPRQEVVLGAILIVGAGVMIIVREHFSRDRLA